MKLVSRIIFHGCANIVAFYVIAYGIRSFQVSSDFREVLIAAAFLTLANIFIRPILKLILSPFIIITFGLFVIAINAFLLYVVDNYSAGITIYGTKTLVIAALIISVINILISSSAKSLFRKSV